MDGGWLTTAGLALAAGCSEEAVERAMYRSLKLGEVEKRTIYLGFASGHHGWDRRAEWRARNATLNLGDDDE